MALLASTIATLILMGLGMTLVLLASTGAALGLHDRLASAADRAADAAVRLAIAELRERPDWSGAAGAGGVADVCGEPGRFVDATLFPRAPWNGATVDLHTLTQQLQAAAGAAAPAGLSVPVWRLFEYGPISRLVPSEPTRHPFYVVTWTADGRGGVVLLHATALGPGGATASVEASVGRNTDGTPVRLAIRSVP
jgi:hypothetical protein